MVLLSKKTSVMAAHLVKKAYEVNKEIKKPFVTGIFAEVGKNGSHNIRIRTYLVDAVKREKFGVSTAEFTNKWRKASGKILGAEYVRFAADAGGPGPVVYP